MAGSERRGIVAAGPGGHVDRRFGRAVEIVQVGHRTREEPAFELRGQRFAARDHPPQGGTSLDPGLFEKDLERRRHEV